MSKDMEGIAQKSGFKGCHGCPGGLPSSLGGAFGKQIRSLQTPVQVLNASLEGLTSRGTAVSGPQRLAVAHERWADMKEED